MKTEHRRHHQAMQRLNTRDRVDKTVIILEKAEQKHHQHQTLPRLSKHVRNGRAGPVRKIIMQTRLTGILDLVARADRLLGLAGNAFMESPSAAGAEHHQL